MALECKPQIQAKAKENERARKGGQRGASCQTSDNLSRIDTKKELATKMGISHDTIARAEFISREADEATKEKQRLRELQEPPSSASQ